MSLKARLIKNSTINLTAGLADSKIFGHKTTIPTRVPAINLALSGRIDGGFSGLTVLAAPSKHFKTAFSLLMASAFLEMYPDGIILFYDSEFGTPQSYFTSFGIPLDSVVHTPITDIEQLKFDIMRQLEELNREDKVLVIVDSVGNLASKKEVDDAVNQKSTADMTRAKQLKSLFRMVTPHLTIKDIPMIVVNHVYMEQSLYPKAIVSGGTGIYYSADNIWVIGRQQEKEDGEIAGYNFVINVEKSRYVREKSRIPISVTYESGINRWSGMLDLAIEAGFIIKPKQGWYARLDKETGELSKNYRAAEIIDNNEFWTSLFAETNFSEWLTEHYSLGQIEMLSTVEE